MNKTYSLSNFMKKKIVILGRSKKFIGIIQKIYKNHEIQIFSWRQVNHIKKYSSLKNSNIIFICGYDYNSQWYKYDKFYKANITLPYKLISYISTANTRLFYIDTIENLKNNVKSKNYTLSRYEFAKKMLRYKLIKNFKFIQIIELPPVMNKNKEEDVFGGKLTKKIFKFLIINKIINFIKLKEIKKKFYTNKNLKKRYKAVKPKQIMLKIPRPLFLDRFLRMISN